MKLLLISVLIVLTGCSTTRLQKQQSDVLDCIKDMDMSEEYLDKTFEVCRQVYKMKKVKD